MPNPRPADKQKMLREHIEAGNVLDEAAVSRSHGPGDTQTLPDRVRTLYRRYLQEMNRRIELEKLRDVHVPDTPPESWSGKAGQS